MNAVIESIYRTGRVQDEFGNEYDLQSHISRTEGDFLAGLINSDPTIRKTLEVGCAYGLSSLFICSSIAERQDARHVIVDPFQHGNWKGVGVANLKRAGIEFFELVQEPSEFALPKLAQEGAESFDLVFIDGWHTFDHTLLDMFYASRLIRVGGYVVVDDCGFASISRAVSYMSSYPCYILHSQVKEEDVSLKRKLAKQSLDILPKTSWDYVLPKKAFDVLQRARYSSMVVLRKIASDERDWTWYVDF